MSMWPFDLHPARITRAASMAFRSAMFGVVGSFGASELRFAVGASATFPIRNRILVVSLSLGTQNANDSDGLGADKARVAKPVVSTT